MQLPLSKYIFFTSLGNTDLLNIVDVIVAAPILPVLGCLVVYFRIGLEISSIAVTTFIRRLIDSIFVPGHVPGMLLPDPELGPDVGMCPWRCLRIFQD